MKKTFESSFAKQAIKKKATGIKITITESDSYAKEIAKATEDIDLLIIGHYAKNAFLAALVDC